MQGAVTGSLVGLLGGTLFLSALSLPSLRLPDFLLWHSIGGLKPADYIGPVVAGVAFSTILSALIEATLLCRLATSPPWQVGAAAAGSYFVVFIGLGYLAWFAPPEFVGSPPNLCGLDMASPFALLTWALLAGLLHAARAATREG